MKLRWYLAPCVSILAACGGSTTSGDTGSDIVDSGTEAGLNDIAPADGADVATDVANLDSDGLHDVAGDVAPDAATGIQGTWRLVQFATAVDSVIVTLTDSDGPITVGEGGTVTARANGLMTLEPTQFTLAFGVLVNDHFITNGTTATDAISFLGAEGFSVPGMLTGMTFSPTGSTTPTNFVLNADGTLSYTDPSNGSQFKFSRATSPPTTTTLSATGQGVLYNPGGTTFAVTHPRVAIAWDQMGGAAHTFDNDQVPTMTSMNTGSYAVAETGAPPAVGTYDTTTVGLGFPIFYDDVNDNMHYDASSDTLYAISPVAIAYRSGTPSASFMSSTFRYLNDGYQYVYVNTTALDAALGLPPFDPTHAVVPDMPIQTTAVSRAIPHLLP